MVTKHVTKDSTANLGFEAERWMAADALRSIMDSAVHIYHIVPLGRGGRDDDSNIRCLCSDCHRVRTAQQFSHRNPISRVDSDGWPVDAG